MSELFMSKLRWKSNYHFRQTKVLKWKKFGLSIFQKHKNKLSANCTEYSVNVSNEFKRNVEFQLSLLILLAATCFRLRSRVVHSAVCIHKSRHAYYLTAAWDKTPGLRRTRKNTETLDISNYYWLSGNWRAKQTCYRTSLNISLFYTFWIKTVHSIVQKLQRIY